MKKQTGLKTGTLTGLLLLFFCTQQLSALDFAILNRGNIIFQEILIKTDQAESDYYFNFGITGLEPGARHNIHISSNDDLLFCSFYLFGISNENYVIENVAIEESSIVYILPEHYQEEIESYYDMDNPDAVYGADLFDRLEYTFVDEENPENQYRTEVEIFNYTNSPIFRVYCEETIKPEEKSPVENGEDGKDNLLHGRVLEPQGSLTVELVLIPDSEYILEIKSSDNKIFQKVLDSSGDNDFLVFYDSDRLKDWDNLSLTFINETTEELKEINLIDPVSGKRVEILNGQVLEADNKLEYLLTENILVSDIIIKTTSNNKIYLLEWDLSKNQDVQIRNE